MATTHTTYATISDLKARLTISSSSSDTLLQSYLDAAAEQIDAITRGFRAGLDSGSNIYEAFSAVTETRYYDDDISGEVPIDDLISVTTITRGGTAVDSAYYKLWPYNRTPAEAVFFRADLAFEPIIVGGSWYEYPFQTRGVAQVAVTGSWGFCASTARPAAIREATLRLAAWAYEQEGLLPKDKMAAIRDPTRPFYWELDYLLAPFKRLERRAGWIG